MTSLFAVLALTGFQAQEEGGLTKALDAASKYSNYTFTVSTRREGGKRAAEGGKKGKGGAGSIQGQYVAGVGLYVRMGRAEFVRTEAGVAMKTRKGEWTNPQGGNEGEAPKKGKKRRDPSKMIQSFKAPHEDAAAIKAALEKETGKEKDGESTVYSASLTKEGIQGLTGPLGRLLQRAPEATVTGSVKVWVNAQGQVQSYEVTIGVEGKIKDRELKLKIVRTAEFSEVGTTKLEIPEGAKTVLGGK